METLLGKIDNSTFKSSLWSDNCTLDYKYDM